MLKLLSNSSLRSAILIACAIFNVYILSDTYFKLRASKGVPEFSYLNDDRPIHMPIYNIPKAEMTFQEVSRFSLDGLHDHKANWNTLYTNQLGIGFQHLGPFHWRYISETYHGLHCMFTMQNDFDKPDHANKPSKHFRHCLFYMRQFFLCTADMTLEDGDIRQRNFTVERVGETRVCRDFGVVADWLDEEFSGWLDLNNVSISDVHKPTTFETA